MASPKKYVVLASLCLGFASLSYAGDDVRGRISNLETELRLQKTKIESVRLDLDQKTSEIEKIKAENNGLVSKLLLQKKLREAQAVSKQLEAMVKTQNSLNQSIRMERSNLMNELDAQIAALTPHKGNRNTAQFQKFQQLVAEKEKLIFLQHQTLIEVPDFNLSSSTQNNKEDLSEKLLVIEDLQKSMKQKIALMKEELNEEQSREFLRNEVAHFLDEESFFGEQSFISSGLNRKENTTNLAALALHKDNPTGKSAAPSETPPVVDPTQPTEPSAPPSGTDAPQTTDADASANLPTDPNIGIQPSISSQSTSFQQPQDMHLFQNLLDQIQETIKDTAPNGAEKSGASAKKADVKTERSTKQVKKNVLQQNIALSEKILNDLDTLHNRISKQIQNLK